MHHSAMARKYRDRKYTEAALAIQNYYRRYKLRMRFERVKSEGCHEVERTPRQRSIGVCVCMGVCVCVCLCVCVW